MGGAPGWEVEEFEIVVVVTGIADEDNGVAGVFCGEDEDFFGDAEEEKVFVVEAGAAVAGCDVLVLEGVSLEVAELEFSAFGVDKGTVVDAVVVEDGSEYVSLVVLRISFRREIS